MSKIDALAAKVDAFAARIDAFPAVKSIREKIRELDDQIARAERAGDKKLAAKFLEEQRRLANS